MSHYILDNEKLDERIEKILRSNESYSLKDVLILLSNGVQYLLHKKDYDGHDYEELSLCCDQAKEIIKSINELRSSSRLVEEQSESSAEKIRAAAPELLRALIKLQKRIEQMILRIPSGELRKEVTQENIDACFAIKKATD